MRTRLAAVTVTAAMIASACGGTVSLDFPGVAIGVDSGADAASSPLCSRAGEVACGANCTSLRADPANCGACGVACGGQTPFCDVGVCASSCRAELTACTNGCVDLTSDVHACGACGVTCRGGTPLCDRGTCAAVCAPGLKACDGACVDPSSVKCSPTQCDGGPCPCATALTFCSGSCVDTRTSLADCGGCGLACMAGLLCKGGHCLP